jgi:hypothetical protein
MKKKMPKPFFKQVPALLYEKKSAGTFFLTISGIII